MPQGKGTYGTKRGRPPTPKQSAMSPTRKKKKIVKPK